jgi:hypothetical protein
VACGRVISVCVEGGGQLSQWVGFLLGAVDLIALVCVSRMSSNHRVPSSRPTGTAVRPLLNCRPEIPRRQGKR